MNKQLVKFLLVFIISLISVHFSDAQHSFLQSQKGSMSVANAFNNKEGALKKAFAAKGLTWPAKYIFIRGFKYDSQLEIWVKNSVKEKYKLFKTYKICMQSGTMGPKRLQGDYQIPEGFYYINEFNPNSSYHLSLGLNYPNASDRILSDPMRPGGDIYIHGSCVSIGCVSVNDDDIEEVYILASYARSAGQEFIPVHIFPIRYSQKASVEYFNNSTKGNKELQKFALQLKKAYDEFEKTNQVPLILINREGDYVIN